MAQYPKLQFGWISILGILSYVVPALTHAVTILTPGSPITTVDDTVNAVCIGIRWFMFACIIASVIFGVWAGWDHVFSEGKPDKTKSAREKFTYALIGAAMAIVAAGVPQIAADFLGAGNAKACGTF